MKNFIKKHIKTLLLTWLGCAVLFGIFYILVISSQKKTLVRLDSEISKTKSEYEQILLSASPENREKMTEQLKELRNSVSQFIMSYADSANLTFDIGRIADTQKVSDLIIKTKADQAIANCSNVFENQVFLSFKSGFNQFYTFLNALERHQPVVFINKFSISRPQQVQGGNDVAMDLAVYVAKNQPVSEKKN